MDCRSLTLETQDLNIFAVVTKKTPSCMNTLVIHLKRAVSFSIG